MAEYYFRLPTYLELSPSQRAAITDHRAIALSGGPGTGKSVVSLFRHITNHSKENKTISQLLSYTTSLALYLKKCTEQQSAEAAKFVDSAYDWWHNHASSRDEIVMDEAQDLAINFNIGLKNLCKTFSYGADNQQLLTANSMNIDGSFNLQKCSSEEALRNEFFQNSIHVLSKNYRNTRRILQLAKRLFPNASIPRELINSCNIEGEYPRLIIYNNNPKKRDDAILNIIQQFRENTDINTAILVPFENPNAIAGDDATANYYYNLINERGNGTDCSIYTNSMNGCTTIKNVHITTFKSSKGLEFDNVIIPEVDLMHQNFKVVSWRDYYVGVTRARSNLYLLSKRDFLSIPNSGDNKIIEKVSI